MQIREINKNAAKILGRCLDGCAYHDVGRLDDSLDPLHGHRSAQKLAELTGRGGEDLKVMQVAVDVHSRHDSDLPEIINLSSRVVVMHEGSVAAVLDPHEEELTQVKIMNYATGRVKQ